MGCGVDGGAIVMGWRWLGCCYVPRIFSAALPGFFNKRFCFESATVIICVQANFMTGLEQGQNQIGSASCSRFCGFRFYFIIYLNGNFLESSKGDRRLNSIIPQ